jgi:hypothetical protein
MSKPLFNVGDVVKPGRFSEPICWRQQNGGRSSKEDLA